MNFVYCMFIILWSQYVQFKVIVMPCGWHLLWTKPTLFIHLWTSEKQNSFCNWSALSSCVHNSLKIGQILNRPENRIGDFMKFENSSLSSWELHSVSNYRIVFAFKGLGVCQ